MFWKLFLFFLACLPVCSCSKFDADKTVYTVEVDYAKPVQELIAEGNYLTVDERLAECTFTDSSALKCTLEVHLLHLNLAMRGSGWFSRPLGGELRRELLARGYRPITIRELIALNNVFPALRKTYHQVELGEGVAMPYTITGFFGGQEQVILNHVLVVEHDKIGSALRLEEEQINGFGSLHSIPAVKLDKVLS